MISSFPTVRYQSQRNPAHQSTTEATSLATAIHRLPALTKKGAAAGDFNTDESIRNGKPTKNGWSWPIDQQKVGFKPDNSGWTDQIAVFERKTLEWWLYHAISLWEAQLAESLPILNKKTWAYSWIFQPIMFDCQRVLFGIAVRLVTYDLVVNS